MIKTKSVFLSIVILIINPISSFTKLNRIKNFNRSIYIAVF